MVTLPFISREPRPGENINSDVTWNVECRAIGKEGSVESPYLLANEYICGCLAMCLRLPIPSFAILFEKRLKARMFASYSFEGETRPRDVEPEILYDHFPDLCTGVAVFDMWVGNSDRHAGNIKVDNPGNPKRFWIFDHERALFGIHQKEGRKRLKALQTRLGITQGTVSGSSDHCLVPLLDSTERILRWLDRIRGVPSWYINEICLELAPQSLTKKEAKAASAFLIDRSRSLGTLIRNARERFPHITRKEWSRCVL